MARDIQRDARGDPVWHAPDGSNVACTEKVKVLNENYREIAQSLQDAFEDAVLMGCSLAEVRQIYADLAERVPVSYKEKS